jgi:hypothetical protein
MTAFSLLLGACRLLRCMSLDLAQSESGACQLHPNCGFCPILNLDGP